MSYSDHNHLRGKKFSVITLGCRVNHYEAEAVASMLASRGAVLISEGERGVADAVVIVTCSVTSAANSKTRKAIRRARRENPGAALVACGCWAQGADEPDARAAGVDILVGNRMKWAIADALDDWFASRPQAGALRTDISSRGDWDALSLDRPRIGTRAFIKVQDGCDRRCSYCAVPFLRGPSVSRAPGDVLSEAASAAENGSREVILTGVQLGGYHSGGTNLAGLVRAVSRVPGVRRLRLGSLEPFALTEELLAAMRDSEIFLPHLHIPLQSGDEAILRSMRRGYSPRDFAAAATLARRYLGDDLHVSTDLIVGFPGESGAAFENSLCLLDDLAVGKVHVFPYSPREGTDSAALERLPSAVVRGRRARALDAAGRLLSGYASRMAGVDDSILVERVDGGVASGWSGHYLRVYARVQDKGNNLIGNELIVNPKNSIGSILLCEGVEREEIILCTDD
jgi:threonylcarbamoyladenosine tRNA methylthiotransferase MtaB